MERTSRHPLVTLVLLLGVTLLADPSARAVLSEPGYHEHDAPLDCSLCHLNAAPLDQDEPARDALRRAATSLCLGCHDQRTGIPDVLGADRNELDERAAGFFATPGVPNPRGHDLVSTTGKAAVPELTVSCTDCHDPHGRGGSRGLRTSPRADGEDVGGIHVDPAATGLGRYERRAVAYGATEEPVDVGGFCASCHDASADRHEGAIGFAARGAHPSFTATRRSGEAVLSNLPREDRLVWDDDEDDEDDEDEERASRVPFVGVGARDFAKAADVSSRSNAVFCLTCHAAHGSAHASALRDDPARSSWTVCGQCHASAFAPDDGASPEP